MLRKGSPRRKRERNSETQRETHPWGGGGRVAGHLSRSLDGDPPLSGDAGQLMQHLFDFPDAM